MSSRSGTAQEPVRVLMSVGPPDGTTKYVDQIVELADGTTEFTYFSWPSALFGRWDVFHVHWPEILVRDRKPVKGWIRRALLRLTILRARITRRAIVRTLHNVRPHSHGGSKEDQVIRELDSRTTLFVRLVDATPLPSGAASRIIPHANYRHPFRDHAVSEATAGRIVYAGRIEPYKGVDTLLETFSAARIPGSTLRIVGRPSDDLRRLIETASHDDPAISSLLDFVPDAVLVREVTSASLIALPYREMHNSGVLFVALSLNRPVLVPRSPANELIRDEVGEDWVFLYDGDLTPDVLRTALEWSESAAGRTVSMPDREWSAIAQAYAQAYRKAVAISHQKV